MVFPRQSRYKLTFVAEPDDVSHILSSIRYEGSRWGHDETVMITIYDGVGGPCLDKSDRKYESVEDECFKILASASVPAVAWLSNVPSNGDGVVARFNLWLALLLVLLSFLHYSLRPNVRTAAPPNSILEGNRNR